MKTMKTMKTMKIRLLWALLSALALAGCGSGVQKNIRKLSGSEDEKKNAMIELSLANARDVAELIAAVTDASQAVETRKDLVTVLFRMTLNQGDASVRATLHGLIRDPQVEVRRAAIKALGDLQEKQSVEPILSALGDADPGNCMEAMISLEKVQQHVSADEYPKLLEQAGKIQAGATTPELRQHAQELLEAAADKVSEQAQQMVVKGQLSEAERKLLEVLKAAPDSKNINFKLGRYYFDNDQREKGLQILERCGCLLRIKKFNTPPAIDGDLSDPCWQDATKIENFFQCVNKFTAVPGVGKAEIRIGYAPDAIYIAYRAFEKSTKNIFRNVKKRDDDVWKDDCTEIFFDTQHGYKSHYQIIINALGTVEDINHKPSEDKNWNAEIEVKAKVEETQWTLEMRIPVKDLGKPSVEPGAVWGFNITTTRCGAISEQGQWTPTYGSSNRPERFGFMLFE
jgi:thioredoxin-like negative regulator of GroEL